MDDDYCECLSKKGWERGMLCGRDCQQNKDIMATLAENLSKAGLLHFTGDVESLPIFPYLRGVYRDDQEDR